LKNQLDKALQKIGTETRRNMQTWITICDTCKRDDMGPAAEDQTHGEVFAGMIEAAAADSATVKTRRVSCLMGCKHGCNVAIQGSGKLAYTLGHFTPEQEAAAGIVAYAEAHAASDTGQVPFRTWPQAIKGHFVTRHPPLPTDDA
jgi:predicted metal-binding protein